MQSFGNIETENWNASFKVDDLAAANVLPEQVSALARFKSIGVPAGIPQDTSRTSCRSADTKWICKTKRLTKTASSRSGTRVQRAIRRTSRDISLIESFENMIRSIWIVQVESLIESERLQQVLTSRSHIARFEHQVLGQLVLRTEVPLLDPGSFQVRDRPRETRTSQRCSPVAL